MSSTTSSLSSLSSSSSSFSSSDVISSERKSNAGVCEGQAVGSSSPSSSSSSSSSSISSSSKPRRRLLLTGGTGFLGFHVCQILLARGYEVRMIARSSDPELATLFPQIEFFEGSILSAHNLDDAMEGVTGVFHLAGLVIHSRHPPAPEEMFQTNVVGTLNVIRAAAKHQCRVVYASSSGVVGCSRDPEHFACDDDLYCYDVVRNWPYYTTKIEAEAKAIELAKELNVELVCMRPSMMLGPGDRRFRSTHTILSFLDGKIPFTPTGGVSYLDIRDAAQAFVRAYEFPEAAGKCYLLAAMNCQLDVFFDSLERISGVPKPWLKLPSSVAWYGAAALDSINRNLRGKWEPGVDPVKAEMASHYWYVSSANANRDLGFKPRNPTETLTDTIRWIVENRARYGYPSKANEQSQRALVERLQKRKQAHALALRYKDPGWAVARL